MSFGKFWHKYGQSITSISIILFIVFSVGMMKKELALKKEISENCGWGEDDYYCYCEKSEAVRVKNKVQDELIFGVENVKLAS